MTIHNTRLGDRIQPQYNLAEIQQLRQFLQEQGTLRFSPLENGLFPAAAVNDETEYTGYASVWVRDNIHVAHAHWVVGEKAIAAQTLKTLMAYFKAFRHRFQSIIQTPVLATDPMNRPHIRFDGHSLSEIDQKWAHAQNDALGYFLWLYCHLAQTHWLEPETEDLAMLSLFPSYFQAIRYWEDEDSGHWEEARKVEASSIGAVVAGLRELHQLMHYGPYSEKFHGLPVEISALKNLIRKGEQALTTILPAECLQPANRSRRYDGALLFLIYPLGVIEADMGEQILRDVINNLQGDYGIKRYLGDSFWAADYRRKATQATRTADVSDDSGWRDALLKPGEEAQWCIFDPIVSTIYGLKYQKTSEPRALAQQTHYLNRSLGQLTAEDFSLGALLCPELYCLEDGEYGPNDATPLLWTQANLAIALHMMERSLAL